MPAPITSRTLLLRAAMPALLMAAGGCGGSGGETLPQLAAASSASLQGNCTDLAGKLGGLANTRITAVTLVPAGTLKVAGNDIAAHCLVTGAMRDRVSPVDGKSYAIGFEMRLPLAWNGRYYYQANGGLDGAVSQARGELGGGPITGALAQGFAVISSDAGHSGPTDFSFGIDPQARLDYGYQAVGTLTPMAKALIRVAYGKGPDRSYIGGCSNGGRHAMVAAARLPDEYDGYIAGAPGFNLPKSSVNSIYKGQKYFTVATNPADLSTAWTVAERAMVAKAIVDKCDALDGAKDGIVQDTTACQAAFDLQRDVPTCTGDRDGTCMTAAQKSVVATVFAGVKLSDGTAIYNKQPFDPGLSSAGLVQWHFQSPVGLSGGNTGVVLKVPPENPAGFDPRTFSLNANIDTIWAQMNATNATYTESAMSFMTPPNPTDMSRLKSRGAKMIVYQGVSDPVFMITDTQAWYDGVKARNAGTAMDFARLFPIPGMSHCQAGPSTDQFDPLSAIVAWVEQGKAPDVLVARARKGGNAGGDNAEVPADWSATRTRPLCPYPQVARYNGSGSLEDAANFSCR